MEISCGGREGPRAGSFRLQAPRISRKALVPVIYIVCFAHAMVARSPFAFSFTPKLWHSRSQQPSALSSLCPPSVSFSVSRALRVPRLSVMQMKDPHYRSSLENRDAPPQSKGVHDTTKLPAGSGNSGKQASTPRKRKQENEEGAAGTVPTDVELRSVIERIQTANPEYGTHRILKIIRNEHPDWAVRNKRVLRLRKQFHGADEDDDTDAPQKRVPTEKELREVITRMHRDHPDFGTNRVFAAIKEDFPH
eukprot:1578838-Rhodomonas_salina.1